MLEGCSSGYAPVSDRSVTQNNKVEVVRSSQREKAPSSYRVKSGDTLYSIAWRYGLDYRQLARANNIGRNFRINAGQKLRLQTSSNKKPTGSVAVSKVKKQSIKTDKGGVATNSKATSAKNANSQVYRKPVNKQPSVKKYSTVKNPKKVAWRWPTNGRVISGYSSKGNVNKGINLAGKRGEAVYAAASGKVVYAGSGLLGYGNLIIINHNQEYLSAYAHNSLILVKENENVNVGAKVAEIGNSGATRMMLHFEIRKDGKPVNPLQYLPKR